MKVYWKMPSTLKPYFAQELDSYRFELLKGNLNGAWQKLERAHIIGQRWFIEHSYVHMLMLQFGIKIKSRKEIMGQIPRLLVGGVKSFVGKIPVGNTGGSNVPPLKKMEIPDDLQQILAKA
ncbi:DUF3703 domain-containing protein [Segetibacter sp.]|jgi:hypothetical protein|uniref:DUF3703 domain-containing protein n=1 Tax=Segetibacter sp. TaxID=2231182 RepID=UPI0026074428|nr:DUF3703 domain-containing protein [Segetibacter sp.]MCW3079442.1 hypothetical protein [Segetibacter sp.]